jgi:hypothetical protein
VRVFFGVLLRGDGALSGRFRPRANGAGMPRRAGDRTTGEEGRKSGSRCWESIVVGRARDERAVWDAHEHRVVWEFTTAEPEDVCAPRDRFELSGLLVGAKRGNEVGAVGDRTAFARSQTHGAGSSGGDGHVWGGGYGVS